MDRPVVVTIRPLAATPHAPTVARWLHAAWWETDGFSLAETEAMLRSATGPGLPLSFVAEAAGEPLGTASLVASDLPVRPDLTPWLAGVWVAPAHARQGIASALVRRVEAAAAGLGVARLHLYTVGAMPLYARLGWRETGAEMWQGKRVTLMAKDLAASG